MSTHQNTVIQNETQLQTPTIYLSDTQIAQRYGINRSTVWRWAATDKTFPIPTKFSAGCTRWKLSEIEAWEASAK